IGMRDIGKRHPEQFSLRVAHHLTECAVYLQEAKVPSHKCETQRSLFEHSTETLFTFAQVSFGLLAISQILHRPDHTPGFSGRVARNIGAVIDVSPRARGPLKPILAGPTRCVRRNRRSQASDSALPVVGMNPVDPPLPGVRRLWWSTVKSRIGIIPSDNSGLQVDV